MESNISPSGQTIIEVDLSTPEIDVELSHGSTPVLETEPISGGGIDTYDANADADDILLGKTAYVGGKKVVGGMPSKDIHDIYMWKETRDATNGNYRTISVNARIDVAGFYEKTPYVSDGHFHESYEAVRLDVVNGTTITPGTYTKTAVSSGNKYIKGSVRVAGSSYLIPQNIKNGITIFGVKGTYTGDSAQASYSNMIEGNDKITSITENYVYNVRGGAFMDCKYLETIDLPNATTIGDQAFQGCIKLTSVDIPRATHIGSGAFQLCESLTLLNLNCTSIGYFVFNICSKLSTLFLNSESIVTVPTGADETMFTGTPIAAGTGKIYVPSSLLEGYKTHSFWSRYKDVLIGV